MPLEGNCSLVYLCANNKNYRKYDSSFVERMKNSLENRSLRVLDLINVSEQEKNSLLLREDNQKYKKGSEKSYDVISKELSAYNTYREEFLHLGRLSRSDLRYIGSPRTQILRSKINTNVMEVLSEIRTKLEKEIKGTPKKKEEVIILVAIKMERETW